MNNLRQFKDADELIAWLGQIANAKNLEYLLAFADDGVIWGYMNNGRLILSISAFPDVGAQLCPETLQVARLFGMAGEFILSRSQPGFTEQWLNEDGMSPEDYTDVDSYLLWGEAITPPQNGFTLFEEGRQGLRHAPPIQGRQAALKMRHYFGKDEKTGQVYFASSRLLGLSVVQEMPS